MRYFVVADVHGFYDQMLTALSAAGFDCNNSNHIFVSCGDLLDRGRQPRECLQFVMGLDPERRILIRGNHEDLMEDAIIRGWFASHDVHNGTRTTAYDLIGEGAHNEDTDILLRLRVDKLYNSYIRECVNYDETKNYIFVHGWIPCFSNRKMSGMTYAPYGKNWRRANTYDWQNARWINGMEAWNWSITEPNKTIVCGHWHSSWGHCHLHNDGTEFGKNSKFTPFMDKGIIAADACTAYSGFCNCVVLDDEPLEEV